MSEKKMKLVNLNGTSTDVSSEVVPADNYRTYLFIQNKSTTDSMYLVFDAPATELLGVKLSAGDSYEGRGEIISQVNTICESTKTVPYVVVTSKHPING